MADYSEFPTTPTAWQDSAWQEVTPLETEDPPAPRRRSVDVGTLIAGIFFVVLAIVLMTGVQVPLSLFRDGGVLWVALIVGGVALLVRELRRSRRR